MPRLAEEAAHPAAAASPVSSPAGFIFMCSGATKPDCYRHQVLGLPRGRLDAVSGIRRGAALFLYDFDIKHLHGPYRAVSDGGLDLVPYAFHGRFPAQVKFKIEGEFIPIHESILRTAIKENYLKGKFSPELNSTQVEKLRGLFEPIAVVPESAPPHYVDDRPPAPAYLPPDFHLAQPAAYAHHPTTYVPPSSAHLVPPESYAAPCSYLAPPVAQPITQAYSVTTTGYGYQAGYEAYGPSPSTYHYSQLHPSCSLYAQYSMSERVSAPVYSTGPYYAAYQNDPYQVGNVTSHYQQSTYERAAYGAGDGTVVTNLQLVRHYGSNPSSLTTASEAAATNLPLTRRYGFTPSDATVGTAHTSEVAEYQQAVIYATHAAGSSAHGATSLDYAYAAPATSQVVSPVISLPPQSVYAVSAANQMTLGILVVHGYVGYDVKGSAALMTG